VGEGGNPRGRLSQRSRKESYHTYTGVGPFFSSGQGAPGGGGGSPLWSGVGGVGSSTKSVAGKNFIRSGLKRILFVTRGGKVRERRTPCAVEKTVGGYMSELDGLERGLSTGQGRCAARRPKRGRCIFLGGPQGGKVSFSSYQLEKEGPTAWAKYFQPRMVL